MGIEPFVLKVIIIVIIIILIIQVVQFTEKKEKLYMSLTFGAKFAVIHLLDTIMYLYIYIYNHVSGNKNGLTTLFTRTEMI